MEGTTPFLIECRPTHSLAGLENKMTHPSYPKSAWSVDHAFPRPGKKEFRLSCSRLTSQIEDPIDRLRVDVAGEDRYQVFINSFHPNLLYPSLVQGMI